MGFYYFAARRTPAAIAADGLPVHRLRYVFKPARFSCPDEEKLKNRLLGPTWRSWERKPLETTAYLAGSDKDGKLFNGAEVHRIEKPESFSGVIFDADLGMDRYPYVGTLLLDGEGPVQVVTREDEAAAWKALGAWWLSASEARRKTVPTYRPSIDISTPHGLLAARLYDASAQANNDERRAYRYGHDRIRSAA